MASESMSQDFANELIEAKILPKMVTEVIDDSKSALKKAKKKD